MANKKGRRPAGTIKTKSSSSLAPAAAAAAMQSGHESLPTHHHPHHPHHHHADTDPSPLVCDFSAVLLRQARRFCSHHDIPVDTGDQRFLLSDLLTVVNRYNPQRETFTAASLASRFAQLLPGIQQRTAHFAPLPAATGSAPLSTGHGLRRKVHALALLETLNAFGVWPLVFAVMDGERGIGIDDDDDDDGDRFYQGDDDDGDNDEDEEWWRQHGAVAAAREDTATVTNESTSSTSTGTSETSKQLRKRVAELEAQVQRLEMHASLTRMAEVMAKASALSNGSGQSGDDDEEEEEEEEQRSQ